MRKLKMKYKMMLLSLSSVIFLTIIGGLGYIQGNKLADASREMYADRLLPISSFNEIDKRFVQVETDILKLIITEERSLKDDLIADLRDHILMIEELLYEFEQQGISQEFALLIADIKSKINTYRGDIQEMVDLAVVRDSNAAYQHYLDTTENRKEIERLVNEISLNSQQIAKHLNDENQSNLQFYNRITLFSFVTSFIVTAFIGFAISTSITRPLDRLNTKLEQFGNGDLSAEMAKDSGKDELAHIQNSTLAMKENLTKLITNVNFSSNRLTESISKQRSTIDGNQASTIQINHLIKEISEGAYQQAARANEILAMLDSSSKNTNAGHVKVEQTLANATESTRIAKEGKEFIAAAITQLQGLKQSIYEATTSVSQLNQRSSEIGTIITTITKISDQTNLLALNAAIEAARAGETGRGFAVVADEVRKLAEETSYSASRITELIQTIQLETTTTFSNMEKNLSAFQEQHELIEKGGYALEHIVEQVEETELSTNELEEIFNTLEKNSNEVLRSVEEITASLEQTAAATEQVSTETEQQHQRATGMKSSADHLEEVNKNLNTELKKFKL